MKDIILDYIVVNHAKELPVHRPHQAILRIQKLINVENVDIEQRVLNPTNVLVQQNYLLIE